jgi:glycosyltransferase involved in cell wall biosynthesis
MNILHLNTHPDGGSQTYAQVLSDALVAMGETSLVVNRCMEHQPLSDKFLRRGSLAFTKGAWHGTHRTLAPPKRELVEGADVIHLHTVADWFDVPVWLKSLPSQKRIVVSLHDLWHVNGGCFVHDGCGRFAHGCANCPLLRFPANRFLASHEQRRKARAYRDAGAKFVANSQWLKELVSASPVLAGAKVEVIPPPVDTAVFRPLDRTKCRADFGLEETDLVVATGCASLTDTNKDTTGLLQILAEMNEPRLRVLVFGDGQIPCPPNLRVSWLGPQRDKYNLARIYSAADVFASASRMETYGLTLAEAYACGSAVVAHDTGGIPEALPRDQTVTLVPLDGRVEFVDAISKQLRRRSVEFADKRIDRMTPCAPSPRQAVNMLAEVYGAT